MVRLNISLRWNIQFLTSRNQNFTHTSQRKSTHTIHWIQLRISNAIWWRQLRINSNILKEKYFMFIEKVVFILQLCVQRKDSGSHGPWATKRAEVWVLVQRSRTPAWVRRLKRAAEREMVSGDPSEHNSVKQTDWKEKWFEQRADRRHKTNFTCFRDLQAARSNHYWCYFLFEMLSAMSFNDVFHYFPLFFQISFMHT